MSFTLSQLQQHCDEFLNVAHFKNKDYCPNGMQIQANLDKPIHKIALAVTASKYVIEQATKYRADALIVHHGCFWKNDERALTHILYERVKLLIQADIPLLAYHLPLDAHPQVGNNQQLAQKLGFINTGFHHDDVLLRLGTLEKSTTLADLEQKITNVLKRKPTLIIPRSWHQQEKTIIENVAWCTGGGDGYFKHFSADITQVYITGEISESCYHLAHESNIAFIAAGHHATERFGIIALGEYLKQYVSQIFKMSLEVFFIDEDNPC